MRKPLEERFLAKVVKTDGYWIWQGATMSSGYGVLRDSNTKMVGAHRIAYELYKDPPGSLLVLHKCDNKLCVNPAHLFLGNTQDNVDDKVSKNRQAIGKQCNHCDQKGENNHYSKVSNKDVLEIRRLFEEEGYSQAQLMKKFSLKRNHIYAIVRYKIRN